MDLRRTLPSVCLVFAGAWAQSAQASPSGPVIALHAKAHTTKGVTICSTWAPNDIDCTEFTTAARTGLAYDVYVVGVNPIVTPGDIYPSVAGVRWAIDYDGEPHRGVDVFSWTMCGDLEFPMAGWPGPRWGNSLTWGDCQTTPPGKLHAQAVAGAFYVYAYSDDNFSVAPFYGWVTDDHGNWVGWLDPVLELASCNGEVLSVSLDNGRSAVKFSAGGTTGFNPCTGIGELPLYGPPPPPVAPPPPPPPTGEHKATLLLHVAAAGARAGSCTEAPTDLDSVRTLAGFSGPGSEYDVFLLATPEVPHDPVGIAAIQTGIEFSPSLDVLSWVFCGSGELQYGEWPGSGSGNTVVFTGCESGEIEVAGYFRVAISEPSLFKLIGHPLTGLVKFADCSSEQVFEDLGQAQVGWISLGGAAIGQDTDGCNPALESCAPGPVHAHQTTWGRLKSKY